MAANPAGEEGSGPLRLRFDRSVWLAFRGSAISSDAGLLLHRKLDDALVLTDVAAGLLVDSRTGRNGRHGFAGLLRQSIYSRLAGYEDVNEADRLCRVPVVRQFVVGRDQASGGLRERRYRAPNGSQAGSRTSLLPLRSLTDGQTGIPDRNRVAGPIILPFLCSAKRKRAMKMMENMMSFMMGRMSKEDKEEMMDTMMGKMLGDMSNEERMEMMTAMMPKMMEGMNMAEIMPRMMSETMGGGCMSPADGDGGGTPMCGMMIQMMPHCMKMAANQTPEEKRAETIVDLLATMLEAGCETLESDKRPPLLQALQSRIETMKTSVVR